jgi:pSer/pThr/pTyr-binding forkhead associated (FHA) protein
LREQPPVTGRKYPNLLLGDRAPLRLDRTAIVGTRPRLSRIQGGNVPHLVTVDSPSGEISRSHVELRVEGFAVLAVDLNSTNGTTLLRVGNEPMRLHPGEPNLLVPGDRIDLGDDVILGFDGLA